MEKGKRKGSRNTSKDIFSGKLNAGIMVSVLDQSLDDCDFKMNEEVDGDIQCKLWAFGFFRTRSIANTERFLSENT